MVALTLTLTLICRRMQPVEWEAGEVVLQYGEEISKNGEGGRDRGALYMVASGELSVSVPGNRNPQPSTLNPHFSVSPLPSDAVPG